MRPGSSLPCQWSCTASDVEGRPSCYELASHYALKIMNKIINLIGKQPATPARPVLIPLSVVLRRGTGGSSEHMSLIWDALPSGGGLSVLVLSRL